MSSLADRLVEAMRNAKPPCSQADLARACGISEPAVTKWINGGTKKLMGSNLLNAARRLGVEPEWLATGRGSAYRLTSDTDECRRQNFLLVLNKKFDGDLDKLLAAARKDMPIYRVDLERFINREEPLHKGCARSIEASLNLEYGSLDNLPDEDNQYRLGILEPPDFAFQDQPNTFLIPHMNGRAKGGGGGLAPMHEYVVGSVSVTNSWLHRRLPSITSKKNLAIIEAYGRSMEPTLMSGDLMVVDTGIKVAKVPGIYILLRNSTPEPELMVKRIQPTIDGGMIVRSDNRQDYDPETIRPDQVDQVQIVGSVVWIWAGREG